MNKCGCRETLVVAELDCPGHGFLSSYVSSAGELWPGSHSSLEHGQQCADIGFVVEMDGSSSCFTPPSQWSRVVPRACGGCMLSACWGCLNSGCPSPQQGGCIWWLRCAGLCSALGMWVLDQSWGGQFVVCCLQVLFEPIDNSLLVFFFFFKYFLQLLQNKALFLYQGVVEACCAGPLSAMGNMDEKLFQDLSSGFLRCVYLKGCAGGQISCVCVDECLFISLLCA